MLLHYCQLIFECLHAALAVLAVLGKVFLHLFQHPLCLSELLLRQLLGFLAHSEFLLDFLQVKTASGGIITGGCHGRKDGFLEIKLWVEGFGVLRLQKQGQLMSEAVGHLFELAVTLLTKEQLAA